MIYEVTSENQACSFDMFKKRAVGQPKFLLSEYDRSKDRMVEILEDRNLSFMFPLLRVQADLWRQIRADPNAVNFYKWIKENVMTHLQTDPGFINTLVTT